MQNFDYQTPTRLIFGKDSIEKLPGVMQPFGKKILLTYGGGSIKKIGLYEKVKELLKDFEIFELGGIEPNPKYATSVLDGVKLCKEQGIDEKRIGEMAHHVAVNEGLEHAYVPLKEADIAKIFTDSL